MNQTQSTAGYSIIEVLVAIAVLLIAIVGPLTIASKGLQNATYAKQQTTAFFLAQEGIEMIIKKRNEASLLVLTGANADSWDWVTEIDSAGCSNSTACGVAITDEGDSTIYACNDTNCDLQLYDTGRTKYRQGFSGGEDSIYKREIFLTPSTSNVRIRSVVSWEGQEVLGDDSVELEVYIYDIYTYD